jgi:predicted GNAT family acetyltransferase
MSKPIVRSARRAKRDRFLSYVAEHASRVVELGQPDGRHATVYLSDSGHVIAAAEYGAAHRAVYQIKQAY